MNDHNLDIIKNKIMEMQPESRIVLFGSRAKGTHNAESDYDILVHFKTIMKNAMSPKM